MKKKMLIAAATLALAVVVTACGGGNDTESAPANTQASNGAVTETGAAAQELVITATDWAFDQKEYRIQKGQPVTLILENDKGTHGIQISNTSYNNITEGKPQTITINDAGTYEIKCNIPCGNGHIRMVSKLIVE
ncbi:cupredoxin domain-containing protein [Paenibacillus tarimensis]